MFVGSYRLNPISRPKQLTANLLHEVFTLEKEACLQAPVARKCKSFESQVQRLVQSVRVRTKVDVTNMRRSWARLNVGYEAWMRPMAKEVLKAWPTQPGLESRMRVGFCSFNLARWCDEGRVCH